MANIGLRRFKFAPINEDGSRGEAKGLAGAIESKLSINLGEAQLYSDDTLTEDESLFNSATLTLGVDDDDPEIFGELIGKEKVKIGDTENYEYISRSTDSQPFNSFSQVIPKMRKGKRMYKAEFLNRVKFKPYGTEAKTKGKELEFTTPSVEGTVFEDTDGSWRREATFETEAEANAYIDNLFKTLGTETPALAKMAKTTPKGE